MTTPSLLANALKSVDWNSNVQFLCANQTAVMRLEAASRRLAVWSKQFENIEGKENPAICFIREMQSAGHSAVTATALSCYKLAASGMRTVVETALYYSYFRTHPSELSTLLRDAKWYVSKQEIIEYHSTHNARFIELQKKFPVVNELNTWYSKISAIVHGQIPGVWHAKSGIANIKPEIELMESVIYEFEQCVRIVDRFFLLTVGGELWPNFSPSAKNAILHGMSGNTKETLGLDSA